MIFLVIVVVAVFAFIIFALNADKIKQKKDVIKNKDIKFKPSKAVKPVVSYDKPRRKEVAEQKKTSANVEVSDFIQFDEEDAKELDEMLSGDRPAARKDRNFSRKEKDFSRKNRERTISNNTLEVEVLGDYDENDGFYEGEEFDSEVERDFENNSLEDDFDNDGFFDFEDFDEDSFFSGDFSLDQDKSLSKEISNMSPTMKAIVMANLLNKKDD